MADRGWVSLTREYHLVCTGPCCWVPSTASEGGMEVRRGICRVTLRM